MDGFGEGWGSEDEYLYGVIGELVGEHIIIIFLQEFIQMARMIFRALRMFHWSYMCLIFPGKISKVSS